jgi:hypothetical protein
MNRTAAAGLTLAGILLASTVCAQTCPPAGTSREQLQELKSREFALADAKRRASLALDLVARLGSTDPAVRDGIAFEALAAWMRGKQLSAATVGAMLQLAVNPRTSKAQLDQMLGAIATQIAPAGEHFYVYGEGDRLAQAVFYIAKRKLHTADEWRKWFEQVAAPAPLAKWADAWTSQRGLAKHHNTWGFVTALYVYARESGAEFQALVLPSIVAAVKQLQ